MSKLTRSIAFRLERSREISKHLAAKGDPDAAREFALKADALEVDLARARAQASPDTATRVRAARAAVGLSQEEFATMMRNVIPRVNPQMVDAWENDEEREDEQDLLKIEFAAYKLFDAARRIRAACAAAGLSQAALARMARCDRSDLSDFECCKRFISPWELDVIESCARGVDPHGSSWSDVRHQWDAWRAEREKAIKEGNAALLWADPGSAGKEGSR